ncbi:sulfate ABC transporter permease subunit CysW [Geminicoccus roseus]|uniref:sulfate ABC transporter permease subunit CysW n=1 Tax=Geminicoccus roseus TaxID=404900 RepID=UPI0004863365|nr:sulfate ABC transporter permease subunit CysW [Geminicoccus roseus]
MAMAHRPRAVGDTPWVRRTLIGAGLLLTLLFLLAPVAVVFVQAFQAGLAAYFSNLASPDTLHAIWLTVLTAVVVVPVNVVFGIAAAWAVTRFAFRGKRLLVTIIELPFSISPIVAGVIYLFLYGAQGLLGPWLQEHGIRIMFSIPAIILVSLFVTSPFVARELIAFMQTQSSEDEEAARSLGASAWQMFWRVTLPNIRWALLYGAILCTARSIGEFGAVSVVSGNIRGQTNTLPLQVELLYNDYNAAGAFAAASVLALIGLVTIVIKALVEQFGPEAHDRRA